MASENCYTELLFPAANLTPTTRDCGSLSLGCLLDFCLIIAFDISGTVLLPHFVSSLVDQTVLCATERLAILRLYDRQNVDKS